MRLVKLPRTWCHQAQLLLRRKVRGSSTSMASLWLTHLWSRKLCPAHCGDLCHVLPLVLPRTAKSSVDGWRMGSLRHDIRYRFNDLQCFVSQRLRYVYCVCWHTVLKIYSASPTMGKDSTLLYVRSPVYRGSTETLQLHTFRLAQCFYGVIWWVAVSTLRVQLTCAHRCSRLSILFTVVRLAYWGTQRRLLVRIAIIFGVVWAILFAQVWWTCETDPSWKKQPRPQCPLGRNVAIAQIVSGLTGFNITINFWPCFSRRFRRHCPYLGSIYSHLQSHIIDGAKSTGDLPLLHVSNHHSCQSHPCILCLYWGRAERGGVCYVRGTFSALSARTGSLIPMLGVYISNRRELECGRYILLAHARRWRNDLATGEGDDAVFNFIFCLRIVSAEM
jgi:hypothetical protein